MKGRQIPCNSWLRSKPPPTHLPSPQEWPHHESASKLHWFPGGCGWKSNFSSLFIFPSSFELMEDILFLIFRMASRRRSEAEDWQRKFKSILYISPLSLFHLILQLSSPFSLSWCDVMRSVLNSILPFHIKEWTTSPLLNTFSWNWLTNWLSFGNFSNKGWFQSNSPPDGEIPKLWESDVNPLGP